MKRWVCVLALSMGVRATAAAPGPDGGPPPAQESILTLHDVGVSFALGVDLLSSSYPGGSATTSGLLTLNVAWAPLDWLEVSFVLPGVSVLLGSRHHDEVLLSAGIDGIGYSSVEQLIVTPTVGVAYRHWLSNATSVGAIGRWSSRYSDNPPEHSVRGSLFVTHTFGTTFSLNFALGGGGWSGSFALTVGSPRPGIRNLPLLQLHLSPVWSIDLDAGLAVGLHSDTRTEQQYLLGFSAIW